MAGARPRSESEADAAALRVVFMGTPELAAHILERLAAARGPAFDLAAVVTRPDRPRGRGLALEASAVGEAAARLNLPLLKPAAIKTPAFLAELKTLKPDVLAIAAYGRILPAAVLAAPRLMPLNVHASLLPRHRGAAPIEGAILAGDRESGVTIMRVTERMDAGPILLRCAIELAPDETQATLKRRLAALGAAALLEALDLLKRGELKERPQDEALATYTKPVKKSDAAIDWRAPAAQIERMVRAYDPWPVARTVLGDGDLMVWRAALAPAGDRGDPGDAPPAEPGIVVALAPDPIVQCGTGRLKLLEVQAAGRRRTAAADFMRGRRLAPGIRLGR